MTYSRRAILAVAALSAAAGITGAAYAADAYPSNPCGSSSPTHQEVPWIP